VKSASGEILDTLGAVADSIEKAMRRASLEFGVYAIGDSGFVYVTQTEMILATGKPLDPPGRFPTDMHTSSGSTGFLDFILSRFRARPGFYRVIAVVVTSRPVTASSRGLSEKEATTIAHGGMATLPPSFRKRVVRDLQCVAHIYEFERAGAADTVSFRQAPLVTAAEHLAAAGVWTRQQLRSQP